MTETQGGAVFNDLAYRYSAPSRHYHNLRHIRAMLATLASFREQSQDAVSLELAVWFHDAVYDSKRKDNEEESAALASSLLPTAGVAEAVVDRVVGMIQATKTHQAPMGDPDCQLLLDADLAILGTSLEEYDIYAAAIRREYDWVAEADYRAGRARILRGFLERERLYGAPPLFQALEGPARANLQREMTWLTRQTSATI